MDTIQQLIIFLDDHSGSAITLITAVYVITTIFICFANIRAGRAARKQVTEMQRQFKEANRPYITCEYILKKRQLCGIRIANHGNIVAKNLTFSISKDFIDALQGKYHTDFSKLNQSEYKLVGIGQSYDFFFSDVKHKPEAPFELKVFYQSETDNFFEIFSFDLSKQLPIYTTEEIEETVSKTLKKQEESLNQISESLQSIAQNDKERQEKESRKTPIRRFFTKG